MTSSHLEGAIQLPNGTWIRGRGLRNPEPAGIKPEYGLYLGTATLRRKHASSIDWPHDWLEWPDFLLPKDTAEAIRAIRKLFDTAGSGKRAELACSGGVGRTGTAMSCLAILAGVAPADAIPWVREHYNHRAVETPWQRKWVLRFSDRAAVG
ncbi:protein-tyrosine phosphatase family protein [Kibdelosporangium phytohabitans]|uniref:Protein tyrosine phosphatase n=1 Tax=Kibdelosporangium phytohabitans TaxID=860235 RepID=A0A0N9I9S2_9PSEU|nr:protein-tyrosine phosphatase family protein [Kibdelosporangium phytohabitans]ALG11398.1 protein tyrosine phosphatase [Kibdelosporangium phytohabitans]MBE1462727.1 protein-tyrosine phosphatase [Kibdelosporangium phytohabitans]